MNDMYLIHFGIRGQKWGIRRWQNPDGTFNEAGKKRYFNIDIDSKRKKYDNAFNQYNKHIKKNAAEMSDEEYDKYQKEADKLSNLVRIAKNDLKNEETKEKLNSEYKKSKLRTKYEEEFKKKGYNDEDAAIAAYKKEKATKIVLAAAGITLAACAAYGAYKYYDYAADKTLKQGSVFKRLTVDPTTKLHDAFFASNTKDSGKYVGMYGTQIKSQSPGSQLYQKTLEATGNIKIASDRNARKTLQDMVKNGDISTDDLKKQFNDYKSIYTEGKQAKALEKALADINKGKINDNVYKAFNMTQNRGSLTTKFYDKIRSKGYDAIRDINDREMSGYNAKSANIYLNNSKFKVSDIKKITDTTVKKELNNEMDKRFYAQNGKEALGELGLLATAGAALYGYDRSQTRAKDNSIVNEYKKEHPKSNLSRNEILENYYGGK